MKKPLLLNLLLLLAVILTTEVTNVSADSFTVYDSIPDNQYLQNSFFDGSFNLASALPVNEYKMPYQITGASVTFHFRDDIEYSYNSYSDPNYHVDSVYTYPDRIVYNLLKANVSYFSDGSIEEALLRVGNFSESSYISSSWSERLVNYGRTLDRTESFTAYGILYTNQYWTDSLATYYGYMGDFYLTYNLGSAALTDLVADGILDFRLNGWGDFYIESGILNVEINKNPVPEPVSMLLFGTGIVGIFGYVRRRS